MSEEKRKVILDYRQDKDVRLLFVEGVDEDGYLTTQTAFGQERVDLIIAHNGKEIEPKRQVPFQECDNCGTKSEDHICPKCKELKPRMNGIPVNRCGRCAYWKMDIAYKYSGECHYSPPRLNEKGEKIKPPTVLNSDCCGRFKKMEFPL